MHVDEESLHREVRAWLQKIGERFSTLESLPGDVSMRRYLRARTAHDTTAIIAVYPAPLDPALDRFLATSRLLSEGGVRVPEILEWDRERALVLVEDLGPSTLYDLRDLGWSTLRPFVERAAETLARIAGLPPTEIATLSPPLDETLLRRELEVGWSLFLEPLGLERDSGLGAELDTLLGDVCRQLDRAPWIPAHRDFMARNLIPLRDGEVAVLDHQDLRLGAATYDIASLLNDSLYPDSALCDRLRTLAGHPGATEPIYHAAVVQRTLKIIGTFERFARRGGVRYRALIPPSFERFLSSLGHFGPAGADLVSQLRAKFTAGAMGEFEGPVPERPL